MSGTGHSTSRSGSAHTILHIAVVVSVLFFCSETVKSLLLSVERAKPSESRGVILTPDHVVPITGAPSVCTVVVLASAEADTEKDTEHGRILGRLLCIFTSTSKCSEYAPLVFLIENLPFSGPNCEPVILAALLKALGRLLGDKGALRLDFMQRGALTVAQDAKKLSSEVRDALKVLNATYPPQMVAATDPAYERKLLDKIQ